MTEAGEEEARIKARNRRNVVIAVALLAFVGVVFAVSVLKMKAGMAP
jgi:hypothetical protein